MNELVGKILGWIVVTILSAVLVWTTVGFIGWDWNIQGWSAPVRALYLCLVYGLLGGWYALQRR